MNTSTIKHDAQGFLTGGKPLFPVSEGENLLRRISDNVQAIRALLEDRSKDDAQPERGRIVATPSVRVSGLGAGESTQLSRLAEFASAVSRNQARASPTSIRAGLPREAAGRIASAATPSREPLVIKVGDTVSNVDARSSTTQITTHIAQIARSIERQRDERGLLVRAALPDSRSPGVARNAADGAESKATVPHAVAPATPSGRDGLGRFSSLGGRGDGVGGPGELKVAGVLREIRDGITDIASVSATGGGEGIDPVVSATHEMSAVAGGVLTGMRTVGKAALPVGRGMMEPGGAREDKSIPWHRRIFSEIRSLRREESVFNRAQLRTLKEIEGKPLPVARGGEGGGGSLLGRLPFAGLAGAAGGALASAGKAMLRRLPIIGGALALFGGAADANAAENDATLTREQKDRRIGRAAGSTVGGLTGMFGGAKAGAMLGAFAGPVGAAIGTVVGGAAGMFFGDKAGEIVGDKVGEWVGDIRRADIAGTVMRLADSAVSYLKSGWERVSSTFEGVLSASAAFLQKMGVNVDAVKKTVGQAVDTAKEKVGQAAEAVKDKAAEVGGAAMRGFSEATGGKVEEPANTAGVRSQGDIRAWEAGQRQADAGGLAGAARAAGRVAGQVRAGYEVGTGQIAPGRVQQAGGMVEQAAQSLGKGAGMGVTAVANRWQAAKGHIVGAANAAGVDAGVLAKIAHFESGFNEDAMPIQKKKDGTRIRLSSAHGYGQFLDGTWRDTLNRHGAKYGVEGAGSLTVEQANKHRGNRQLQAQMLAEFTKENIEKGRRFGGKDDDANVYAFHNLGDGDARRLLTGMQSGMTVRNALSQGVATAKNPEKERRRVEAVIKGNKSLYGDGSISAADAYANMGKAMRGGDVYAADARLMQQTSGVSGVSVLPAVPRAAIPSAPAASVSAPVPKVNAASIAPPIAPAVKEPAQQPAPINKAGRDPLVVHVANQAQIGRDLPDRRIAHIVTGGMSY